VITGYYADSSPSRLYHGFIRQVNGAITSFDLPGSTGTFPQCINDLNAVVGWATNDHNSVDAFLRLPN